MVLMKRTVSLASTIYEIYEKMGFLLLKIKPFFRFVPISSILTAVKFQNEGS